MRKTKEQFIKDSIKVHGEKYDYEKVDYVNWKTKVIIICKIHGDFSQRPNDHLASKAGCMKCCNLNRTHTKESFIKMARKVHGDKYNYDRVDYKTRGIKVKIFCSIHGEFLQTPGNHISLKQNCPKCKLNCSKFETEWLDYIGIGVRHAHLPEWTHKVVDGIDINSKTVYEYLGDYYHGNPLVFKRNVINYTTKKTFGELYDDTVKKFDKITKLGYTVKYIWENDWKRFKDGKTNELKVLTFSNSVL